MDSVSRTCEMIESTLRKSQAFRKVDEKLYVVHQGSAYVTIAIMDAGRDGHQKAVVRVYAQVVTGVHAAAFVVVEKSTPAVHPMHARSVLVVGTTLTRAPTAQFVIAEHVIAFVTVEKSIPTVQVVHVRSMLIVGTVLMRKPGAQFVTGAHVAALIVEEKSALAVHSVQTRLVLVVAAVETRLPAAQVVSAVHDAALVAVE